VPALPEFFEANPDTRLELEVSLEVSNLNIGEADIAVRMFQPQSETLIARKLPSIRLQLYCSAGYLAGRNPNALCLSEEKLVWYDKAYGDIAENVWIKEKSLVDQVIMRSGSVRALLKAAEAGIGIAPVPDFLAAKTELIPVASQALPIRQTWIVFHRDARTIIHQKRVRDWIRNACDVFDLG
jgi:DNA-binding transcriptional LysR family regulator